MGKLVGALRKRGDYLIIFLLSVAATLLWFRGESLAIGGDYIILFHPSHWITRYLSAWNTWVDAGTPLPPLFSYTPVFDAVFFSIFLKAGLNLSLAQKLYITLMNFIGAASTYYLASILMSSSKSKRVIAFFSALVYLYNPWVISAGFSTITIAHAPRSTLFLFLALYIKGLETRKIRYALLLGPVSFFLMSIFPGEVFFIFVTLASLLYTVYHLVQSRRTYGLKQSVIFLLKFVSVALVASFTANLYWLVPFIQTYTTFTTKLEAFPVTWSTHEWTTMLNVLRLLGNWPFFQQNFPYSSAFLHNPLIISLTFVLPLLAFASLLLKPREGCVVFFSLLSVILIFLAKGVNSPFGGIYRYLVYNFPFFKLFYNSFIFIQFTAVVYSLLVGVSCGRICGYIFDLRLSALSRKLHIVLKGCVVLFLFVLIVTISWPLVTGDVFTNTYKPGEKGVTIPQYYFQTNEWLNAQPGDFRVFILPQLGAYVANNWGYLGSSAFYQQIFTQPLVTGSGIIYGLSSPYSRDMISYIYRTVELGELLQEESTQLQSCDTTEGWHLSESTDVVSQDKERFIEGGASAKWTIDKSVYATNGHQIVFDVDQLNWSRYDVSALWVYGDVSDNFQLGIEDLDGSVGWYYLTQHIVHTDTQGWHQAIMLLRIPDSAHYDINRVRRIILRYDIEQTQEGSAAVWIDNIYIGVSKPNDLLFGKMLALLNAKYVLVDSSLDWKIYPDLRYERGLAMLNSSRFFHLAQAMGSLWIYENDLYVEHLYTVSKLYIVNGNYNNITKIISDSDFDPRNSAFVLNNQMPHAQTFGASYIKAELSIEKMEPSCYVVHVWADAPFVLVFSETFDSGWKAQVEGNDIGEHFIINGYANGWHIQKEGEYNITITFEPQKLSNLPKLVSAIGILACIIIPLVLFDKKFSRLSASVVFWRRSQINKEMA